MKAGICLTPYFRILDRKLYFWVIGLNFLILTSCTTVSFHQETNRLPSTLPNLSGLAWIEDDLFLGIHDTKRNPENFHQPRISLLRLPVSEFEGLTWEFPDSEFPDPLGPGTDLESAARIPGGQGFLFAESGQEGKYDARIFFAVYEKNMLRIESYVSWPVRIENVEAIEVCKVGGQLVFLYAERADSLPETKIRWTELSLNPLGFGSFKEVTYKSIDPVGEGSRPIVALAVDSDNVIYSVSTYDSGNDGGPFRSAVWQIGKMVIDEKGNPEVKLTEGKRLATMDGLKVESIAVRESKENEKQIYVGTDDEHYGGILRLLPNPP